MGWTCWRINDWGKFIDNNLIITKIKEKINLKDIDIAISTLKMTAEREEVIDFVAPFYEETGISIGNNNLYIRNYNYNNNNK